MTYPAENTFSAGVPLVSVIILNWNGRPLLEKCLPSVLATDYPNLEIIVADNASSDDSVAWLKAHYPSVISTVHDKNEGYAGGNNRAFKASNGKYVVFLNNDVEVPSGWLRPLVERMESDPRLAALQPKILDYHDRNRFEYAGAAGGFLDAYGYPFARGRIFDTLEEDNGQYDQFAYVFWASGAAFLARRTCLEKTGLFDEQFFMHMEEIDLCWRLQRHGFRIGAEPASHVFHIGGASLPIGNARKVYYNFRNSLLLLYKNLPRKTFKRRLFVRMILDGLAFVRFLLTSPSSAFAILRAHRDAHQAQHRYAECGPGVGSSGEYPGFPGSIVWSYYGRRKTTFSTMNVPDMLEKMSSE